MGCARLVTSRRHTAPTGSTLEWLLTCACVPGVCLMHLGPSLESPHKSYESYTSLVVVLAAVDDRERTARLLADHFPHVPDNWYQVRQTLA